MMHIINFVGLEKSRYQVNVFLFSLREGVLWVLIRNVSLRRFLWGSMACVSMWTWEKYLYLRIEDAKSYKFSLDSTYDVKLTLDVWLSSCKSALSPPVVCSTDRSKAVVPVLVLLFVALWFILRGDLLYVFPCVILFLCFSVLLVLRLPRLGLILVLFIRLFGLCLFGFVGFLFLLGSGKGCGLWLWLSLDFSLTFFCLNNVSFQMVS